MALDQDAPAPDGVDPGQWSADRQTEGTPLPYSNVPTANYNEAFRGADLAAAERSNVARAAGELGITTDQYSDLRRQLGRSPRASDIK